MKKVKYISAYVREILPWPTCITCVDKLFGLIHCFCVWLTVWGLAGGALTLARSAENLQNSLNLNLWCALLFCVCVCLTGVSEPLKQLRYRVKKIAIKSLVFCFCSCNCVCVCIPKDRRCDSAKVFAQCALFSTVHEAINKVGHCKAPSPYSPLRIIPSRPPPTC